MRRRRLRSETHSCLAVNNRVRWPIEPKQQGGKVIGALSYFGGGQEDDKATATLELNPYFSMITCKSCDRQFFPIPPTAICPWCDTAYLIA